MYKNNEVPAHELNVPFFTIKYLWLTAAITLVIGTTLLLFPTFIMNLFFNTADAATGFFVRMVGSTLIGYATLNAIAAHSSTRAICRAVVWSNLSTLLIASIVTLYYQNKFYGFGWLVITQHLVFALGFAYSARQLSGPPKTS